MNCWEFKKCGVEKMALRPGENGVCPAYPDHGRHCARVSGTACDGRVQGPFSSKLATCMRCGFYQSQHYDKTFRAFV
jgi:hypothetical protein